MGWMGLGWDLCAGLLYEHRFAMLKSKDRFYVPGSSWSNIKILPSGIIYWSNQGPSRCKRCCQGGPNDGSTLNNEAEAQTLNGPSVLYDRQHFSALSLSQQFILQHHSVGYQQDDKIFRGDIQLSQNVSPNKLDK